ncbi:MAG: hypothetical protein ACI3XJ_02510 [Oscillospiraceae bacterium]
MPTQITDYKCPACTGPLHFVGESGRLECDYCGASYDVAEIEALYAEKEQQAEAAFAGAEADREETPWDVSGMSGDWGADADRMRAYNCPSCGAELICDETTAATSCPYCGNNTIVPGQFSGELKPDYVIPFKLDKEAAKRALKNHYRGKFFLPRAFSAANHIEEIKGLYVPFWLFDARAQADCSFHATRSHTHQEEDWRVTVTEHYSVRRAGAMDFERVPADASQKMPDDYMDSIEPYDYGEMKPFSTAYLPGYLADKYDVSAEESMERADRRCRNSATDVMRRDVGGYETVNPTGGSVRLLRGKVHYALLPVWTLHTKWSGKDYLFMMNGQTGKVVGDLPVSYGKFWGLFAVLAVLFSALAIWIGAGQWLAELFLG